MPKDEKVNFDALRHSTAHLLAAAVLELWPDAKLTIGPAIEHGFYYDIEFSQPISEKDFSAIEKKMRELVPSWTEFAEQEVSIEEAKEKFADNPYKAELIEEIAGKGEPITLYTSGTFTDLCRGGHVESPSKELKHFKLLSLAGAYWRGDEKNQMLTRIYGTAFSTKEELDAHLALLEEAKQRDHRKLGKQLDLFTFSPLVGSGLPLFTPRGTIVREELQKFLYELQDAQGYQRVTIPHLATAELYKTSGHWEKFQEALFHVEGASKTAFALKPMNCPHHTQIYASSPRSYKDLPVRYSEVTTVYRDEQAGELQGLTRVRSITQDDGHVFCRPDQIAEEIDRIMAIIDQFYAAFNLSIDFRLSLREPANPQAYLGEEEIWQTAEDALRSVLQARKMNFTEEPGEATFYGPKIDFVVRDSLGRSWQLATIQLDFNMPGRFGLTYTDQDGSKKTPVMIHRAISGSLERFMALILEHFAGNLPLWLAPTQVLILPISEEQMPYCQEAAAQLKQAGMRVEIDETSASIGKKIRNAELNKVPVMLIVGKKEVEGKTASLRTHAAGDQGAKPVDEIIKSLTEKIQHRL